MHNYWMNEYNLKKKKILPDWILTFFWFGDRIITLRKWAIDQLSDWLNGYDIKMPFFLFHVSACNSPEPIFDWGLKEWEAFVSALWSTGLFGFLQECLQIRWCFHLRKWTHHWPVGKKQNQNRAQSPDFLPVSWICACEDIPDLQGAALEFQFQAVKHSLS